jgi:hypothetical protein
LIKHRENFAFSRTTLLLVSVKGKINDSIRLKLKINVTVWKPELALPPTCSGI